MINRHLTEAEQAALWRRHWCGDSEARSLLIERYSYLVPLTVRKAVPHVPAAIEFADLLSGGYIGLIRAVDKFDPTYGVKFRSLAISLIRCACLEYLRAEDWVPRSVRDKEKRGEAVQPIILISLDDLLRRRNEEEQEDDFRRLELLADPRPGPEEMTLAEQQAYLIRALVRFLPFKERQVIRGFYWQDRTGAQLTKPCHASESALHVRHRQALEHLRQLCCRTGAFTDG